MAVGATAGEVAAEAGRAATSGVMSDFDFLLGLPASQTAAAAGHVAAPVLDASPLVDIDGGGGGGGGCSRVEVCAVNSAADTAALLTQWRSAGSSSSSSSQQLMLEGLSPQQHGSLWLAGWQDNASPQSSSSAAAAFTRLCSSAAMLRSRMDFDWDDGFRRDHAALCADFDVIDRDVPRTQLASGGEYRAWMAAELTQVLEAHLVAESEMEHGMGYVQGMADIAAFLLQRLPPAGAYQSMRHLCERPLVRTFFRLDIDEWLLLSTVVSNVIGVHCPRVFAKLADFDLEPAMYLPEWLMPLWTRSLSDGVASHVFSRTLIEGDAIFVRAALAVCLAIEPTILASHDMQVRRTSCMRLHHHVHFRHASGTRMCTCAHRRGT